jgi:hypothetical protein
VRVARNSPRASRARESPERRVTRPVHALVQAGCCQHRPPSSAAAATATAPRRSHQPSPSRKIKAATRRHPRRPRVAPHPAQRAHHAARASRARRFTASWLTGRRRARVTCDRGFAHVNPVPRGARRRRPQPRSRRTDSAQKNRRLARVTRHRPAPLARGNRQGEG